MSVRRPALARLSHDRRAWTRLDAEQIGLFGTSCRTKERFEMKTLPRTALLAAALAALPVAAQAKGCIKGAIVGAVAGHYVGHTKTGAVAGCIIGHSRAAKRERMRDGQVQSHM